MPTNRYIPDSPFNHVAARCVVLRSVFHAFPFGICADRIFLSLFFFRVAVQQSSSDFEMPSSDEFLVICLCAEWCGTCRDFRNAFSALASEYSCVRFLWLDIEDHADALGDLDIENFPTIMIRRGSLVLFFGTVLPHVSHLRRMVDTFLEQTPEQSRLYARSNPERSDWQENRDLRRLGLE